MLRTVCPEHGTSSRVVSTDARLFESAVEVTVTANAEARRPYGLIVELLGRCNVKCPTCIAGSTPSTSAEISIDDLATALRAESPSAILFSGGEPTIHPDLDAFVEVVEGSSIPGRVIITNGLRLANERAYRSKFLAAAQKPWEVYLQFDSTRPDVVKAIRGTELGVRHRQRALQFLNERDIPTTLVCVIDGSLNLDEIEVLFDVAVSNPCVVGLQLQPIRLAGRVSETSTRPYALSEVTSAVADQLGVELAPHVSAPLAVADGTYDRRSAAWSTEGGRPFFIPPTAPPGDEIRLTVMEYADKYNWSSLRRDWAPLRVLDPGSPARSTDDYFLEDAPSSMD